MTDYEFAVLKVKAELCDIYHTMTNLQHQIQLLDQRAQKLRMDLQTLMDARATAEAHNGEQRPFDDVDEAAPPAERPAADPVAGDAAPV